MSSPASEFLSQLKQEGALLRGCSAPAHAVADCLQAERLYSADGSVFLVAQTDGNLVIYNAYAVQQFGGTTPVAALWASNTYNNGGPQPFILAMQQVTPEPPSCAMSALRAPRVERVMCSFSSLPCSLPRVF